MADIEGVPEATSGEGGVEAPIVNTDLPSDKGNAFAGFSDDFVSANTHENGLFLGRYKDGDAFLEAYKTSSAAAARLGNENKQLREGTTKDAQAEKAAAELAQKNLAAKQEILPEILNNNMQFNDELVQKITDAGLDINELKVSAYEAREKISAAQSLVGGSEEYIAMVNWAKDNITPAQQEAFNNDVAGSMSEFAVKGLYAHYKEASANQEQSQERIYGDGQPRSVGGYTSQQDMIADRTYIQRNPQDKAAAEKHRQMLSKTDPKVLGMR